MDVLISARDWDERHRTSELIWKAGPNQRVRQYTQDLPPETALDLASGEGRNAIRLADRGWQVTAVDFSAVVMEKARELASQHGDRSADRANLTHGVGGPSIPEVLYIEDDVLADLREFPDLVPEPPCGWKR